MPSFYGENPPDTEVGSTDATESQISEDAVTETDTSGGFYQGSPEQTTTEAYEADARTARDAALAAQEAAEDAQAAAEASESAASSSESNAASSQSAAAASASNASNSASAAAGSATTAATQASNASTSASEAASSASAAASSESAAASSQSAAASSQTAAAGSATAAASSAGTASTKASEAATSATNAAASESAAASSESNASTSASQAATSATNAAASESAAASSETNAASSASAASTSASNAASSASAASSSATAAASSASSASTSATAAGSARDAALAALDSFDDRYLGQKSSEPSVDNDGNALVAGALFFDTVNTVMKVYDGSQWLAAYASVSGALLAINNLDDVSNTATARSNLGLGTAAEQNVGYFATAAQGSLADSALQNGDNVSVLTNDSGYLTGNETITLTGDVSGSGTTLISVTIADDSHNHVISNVDGLQAALDAKQDASTALTTSNYSTTLDGRYYTETEVGTFFSGSSAITGYNKTNWDTAYGWGNHASAGYQAASTALTTSTTFGGDVSGTYNAIVVANDSHTHDGRYYTESEADSRFVNASGDTITSGGNTALTINHSTFGQGLVLERADSTNSSSIKFTNTAGTAGILYGRHTDNELVWRDGASTNNHMLWHEGNDGAGSGLDADTVDGLHASSFLRDATDSEQTAHFGTIFWNESAARVNSDPRANEPGYNANNINIHWWTTTAAGANYGQMGHALYNGSAYQYLHTQAGNNHLYINNNVAWNAGNDGAGSGLDADLLDGNHSSFFADKTNEQTFNAPININGGTSNGTYDATLYVTATSNADWGLVVDKYNLNSYEYGIDLRVGASSTHAFRILGNGGEKFRINGAGQAYYQSSYPYWHSANDGSGSGLDADLLDGQQGSYYRQDWSAIDSGTRTDYNLAFRPNSGDYAGFRFLNDDGTGAGYLLMRSTASDSFPPYTAGGITLVSDSGGLNFFARGGSSQLVRMGTGNTESFRLSASNTYVMNSYLKTQGDVHSAGQVRASGWWGTTASSNYTGFAFEIGSNGSTAYALAYNRDTASYGPMQFEATSFGFNNNTQIDGGSAYPLQVSSTQRYQMQIRNPNNSISSTYGWWLATDTNFNFVLHADGSGDKLTLTRTGDMTLAGGLVTNGNVNANSGVFAISGTTVIDGSRNMFATRLKATTAVQPGSLGYWKLRDNNGGSELTAEYSTLDALSDANIRWRVNTVGTTYQIGEVRAQGDIRSGGQVRATGWHNGNGTNYSGLAFEIGTSSGEAYALSYNRDTSSYGYMNFDATGFRFRRSDVRIDYSLHINNAGTGNNRIYFNGYRAMEGNNGSLLQIGEGYSWTKVQSNLEVDAGQYTEILVKGDDNGTAQISLYGDSQGTGRVYVGQSSTYGGGIEYNGDSSPATTGAGSDYITLYRTEAGNSAWTARNKYNSNDWEFRGNVTAYASDARLKENVTTITDALKKVQRLRGVEFDWKDECEDLGFMPTMQHETGVIAQEVQAVIPDAAYPAPFNKEYLTVQKDKIVPLLIEAIKELKAEVDDLKAQLKGG